MLTIYRLIMDDRAIIWDAIARARRLNLHHVYFSVKGIASPPDSIYFPTPRLIVMTEGNKTAMMPLTDGAQNLVLETGDALYCFPDSWEKHDWEGSFEMLCVVPRQDYLRVSLYRKDSASGNTRPEPFFLHTGLPYHECMRNLLRVLSSSVVINDPDLTKNLFHALLAVAEHECKRKIEAAGKPELLFQQISQWVEKSFQEDISRDQIAQLFNISSGYLSQLFKKCTGKSFSTYLSECRMSQARELLVNTEYSVKQIADYSGFHDYVHFVRRFRELNGISPGQYRHQG